VNMLQSKRWLLVLGVSMIVLSVSTASAAEPTEGAKGFLPSAYVLTAGFALALAAGLAALGQGRAVSSAVDAIGRQPGAAQQIQVVMILGLAFMESLALFVFVMAIILLYGKPIS